MKTLCKKLIYASDDIEQCFCDATKLIQLTREFHKTTTTYEIYCPSCGNEAWSTDSAQETLWFWNAKQKYKKMESQYQMKRRKDKMTRRYKKTLRAPDDIEMCFCGKTEMNLVAILHETGVSYGIYCPSCDNEIWSTGSRQEAIDRWDEKQKDQKMEFNNSNKQE